MMMMFRRRNSTSHPSLLRQRSGSGSGSGSTSKLAVALKRRVEYSTLFFLLLLLLVSTSTLLPSVHSFTTTTSTTTTTRNARTTQWLQQFPSFSTFPTTTSASATTNTRCHAYVPQSEDSPPSSATTSASTSTTTTTATTTTHKPLIPQVGDLVRYYDLDGGQEKGQELVGRLTFITKTSSTYLCELLELEDLGDGYFAEYSSVKRSSKRTDRDILQISPVRASFVRSEQAYKVPYDASKKQVLVRQDTYDVDGWEGPQSAIVNADIVQMDGWNYQQLKKKLLKDATIAGLLGTVIINIIKGPQDAIIYLAGAIASVGYLFFLSIKTDTLANPDTRKLGSNVSNIRFVLPVIVILGVALYNQQLGDANPLKDTTNPFDKVTPEQFGAAVLGFLTYRIPLFVGQIQYALKDGVADAVLPGSAAGIAMQQLAKTAEMESEMTTTVGGKDQDINNLIPVLLVSGPQWTGRDELVQSLLDTDDRFVPPILIDRRTNSVTFDRLQDRNELLQIDQESRYGWTKDGILQAAAKAYSDNEEENDGDDHDHQKVVVVNANVDLAKQLQSSLSGARLIGVWVGLDSVEEFERCIGDAIDQGKIPIQQENGDTREKVLRTNIKQVVQEIDYGLSSGIFEFTILNKDPNTSLKELKEAANYCFK